MISRRRTLAMPLLTAAGVWLGGCDNADSRRVDDTRAQLVGSWLRELDSEGVKGRRVITLGQDGKFTERASVVMADGKVDQQDYAGEWSYDGTNLKRRYLQEKGRQLGGGKMYYATYEITAISAREFVAKDNRAGLQITYRRVPDGTQP